MYIILIFTIVILISWRISDSPIQTISVSQPSTKIIQLSEELLLAVKTENPTGSIEKELSNLQALELIQGLGDDNAKKAFWINIYNAWYQILAKRKKITNHSIFTQKDIPVAGYQFSLDDIEHGILRRYRWKLSMGYLPQFFPSTFIKQIAVSTIDYRIHFALNCGAASCPPIAFYKYGMLDMQLDLATSSFLSGESNIDTVNKVITTSKILYWFKGDFHGKKGMLSLFSKIFKKDFSGYSLVFKKYNWSSHLNNWQ